MHVQPIEVVLEDGVTSVACEVLDGAGVRVVEADSLCLDVKIRLADWQGHSVAFMSWSTVAHYRGYRRHNKEYDICRNIVPFTLLMYNFFTFSNWTGSYYQKGQKVNCAKSESG